MNTNIGNEEKDGECILEIKARTIVLQPVEHEKSIVYLDQTVKRREM